MGVNEYKEHTDEVRIHHYTSLENLALILKNRTIRLSPLSMMDDKQEMKNRDIQNLGEFVFVSCWTKSDIESIPMWNMYTSIESGVRISMKRNPFERQDTPIQDFVDLGFTIPKDEDEKAVMPTFLNLATMLKSGCFSPQAYGGDVLFDVIYTDDEALLNPKVDYSDNEKVNLQIGSMGRYKNSYWAFQDECRYIMTFLNVNPNRYPNIEEHNIMVNRLRCGMERAPFKHYDLNIRDDAFDTMIVTPSPKMSAGNRILLDSLLETHNNKAQIEESKLVGLL